MAEGYLRRAIGNRFQVASAGVIPKSRVHPLAVEVMTAAAIDALLPMTAAERATLANRLVPAIESRKGRKVGEIRPVAGLVESIREGRGFS